MRLLRPRRPPPRVEIAWPLPAAVVVTLIGLVIVFARAPSRQDKALQEFGLTWMLKPVGTASPLPAEPPGRPRRFDIVLDVSSPMAGFLAPAGEGGAPSALMRLVELAPDHLARADRQEVSPLTWWRVAEAFEELARPERVEVALFSGGASRLDLALGRLRAVLEAGAVESALLLTDLVATGELTGAQGAGRLLGAWARSPLVQSGGMHWGLLGVRAPYWGARSSRCVGQGELGCWFSEQTDRFYPLTERAAVPLYALVLGPEAPAVDQIGRGLQAELEARKLEVRWELLTSLSQARPAEASCRAHRLGDPDRPQYALVLDDESALRCERSETVALSCVLPEKLPFIAERAAANWPAAEVSLADRRLELAIDCAALRRVRPAEPLRLTVAGRGEAPKVDPWEGWSKSSDHEAASLDRTLQLALFLEQARLVPGRMELVAEVGGGKP